MTNRKLALVTGASAGIGAAFARAYAARGFDVALAARRMDRLEVLAAELTRAHGGAHFALAADLATPEAPKALMEALKAAGREPDVLVNNAGYGLPGAYQNTTWADQAAFIQVMVTSVADLCHRALPGMLARKRGRIVNVASLAALVPSGPGHTLYAASKAFLVKMSQSLNLECQGTGVHVSALCPGFTYSEFHDVNGTRKGVSQMPKWMWMTAEDVAEAGVRGVDANEAVIVPGGANRSIAGLAKLMPEPLAMALVKSQAAKFRRME